MIAFYIFYIASHSRRCFVSPTLEFRSIMRSFKWGDLEMSDDRMINSRFLWGETPWVDPGMRGQVSLISGSMMALRRSPFIDFHLPQPCLGKPVWARIELPFFSLFKQAASQWIYCSKLRWLLLTHPEVLWSHVLQFYFGSGEIPRFYVLLYFPLFCYWKCLFSSLFKGLKYTFFGEGL